VKYKQTAFGIVWAIFQPLALMAIFTLIFSRGLKINSEGLPYPLFAFSGLMIWNIFSSGLSNSANSMVMNANIIKKIYFPRLIIPISSVLTAVFDFLFAFVVFIGLVLYYKQDVNYAQLVLHLLLSLLLTGIVTLGLGTFLAAWNVKYRDFQYALPFFIQFLLFVNPVLYGTRAFNNEWFALFMRLNPLASAINLVRSALGSGVVDWTGVMLSFSVALGILMLGIYTFRKTESYFADLA
jgi:lipopolysaccharide transport system permease protein